MASPLCHGQNAALALLGGKVSVGSQNVLVIRAPDCAGNNIVGLLIGDVNLGWDVVVRKVAASAPDPEAADFFAIYPNDRDLMAAALVLQFRL